jgi:hypothetical protein
VRRSHARNGAERRYTAFPRSPIVATVFSSFVLSRVRPLSPSLDTRVRVEPLSMTLRSTSLVRYLSVPYSIQLSFILDDSHLAATTLANSYSGGEDGKE